MSTSWSASSVAMSGNVVTGLVSPEAVCIRDICDRRDMPSIGGDDRWAVLGADGGRAVERQKLHGLIALSAENLVGLVPKYFLSLRIPEHDGLIQVDAISAIRRASEAIEYACEDSGHLGQTFSTISPQYSRIFHLV